MPHLCAELVDRAAVAVAHDGNEEPGVGLHGNAEVVAVEEDDLVALEARVQLRELLQGLGDGLEHGRHEHVEVDPREVAFLDPGHGRDFAVGSRHVLGDHTPHTPQGLAPSLSRPGRAADVFLGDASLRAGARERVQLNAELLRDLAHERCRASFRGGRRLRDGLTLRLYPGRAVARVAADDDEHRPNRDDLPFLDQDARDGACSG